MRSPTLKSDELKILAAEAEFDKVDETELYDVVFGQCSCCCNNTEGGNNISC